MTRRSPKKWRERLHSLYRWHRWLGVSAALFVLWLAVSGIALNHADDWDLSQQLIASPGVLAHYGLEVEPPESGFRAGLDWVTVSDGQLWFNDRWVTTVPSRILAAAQVDRVWFAAGRHWLILGDPDGNLIEQLDAESLPHEILAADSGADQIRIQGYNRASKASIDLRDWSPYKGIVTATVSDPLPRPLAEQIALAASARYLTLERLLRDLHSGRFFGTWGMLVMDAAAIIMAILALTGLVLWLRYVSRWIAMRKRRR